MTSLGRREDLFDLRKEGVIACQPLALHKYALAQSLRKMLASCKDPDREDFTNQFCLESSLGSQRENQAKELSNFYVKYSFYRTTPSARNLQFCSVGYLFTTMHLNILALFFKYNSKYEHFHQVRALASPFVLP